MEIIFLTPVLVIVLFYFANKYAKKYKVEIKDKGGLYYFIRLHNGLCMAIHKEDETLNHYITREQYESI